MAGKEHWWVIVLLIRSGSISDSQGRYVKCRSPDLPPMFPAGVGEREKERERGEGGRRRVEREKEGEKGEGGGGGRRERGECVYSRLAGL